MYLLRLFYSALKTGSDHINIYTNVPKEIVAVIQALIILFLAVKFLKERTPILDKIFDFFSSKSAKKATGEGQ